MWLISSFGASVEPGRKRPNDCNLLTDCKLPKVPVIFIEGESISPSEANLQVRQFFVTPYPASLEEYPAAVPGGLASIDVLAGDLEGEADCNLADCMGGPHLSSRATIRGAYGCLR